MNLNQKIQFSLRKFSSQLVHEILEHMQGAPISEIIGLSAASKEAVAATKRKPVKTKTYLPKKPSTAMLRIAKRMGTSSFTADDLDKKFRFKRTYIGLLLSQGALIGFFKRVSRGAYQVTNPISKKPRKAAAKKNNVVPFRKKNAAAA